MGPTSGLNIGCRLRATSSPTNLQVLFVINNDLAHLILELLVQLLLVTVTILAQSHRLRNNSND